MPTITPFLWFDDKAEEAAAFYTGIFKNSKMVSVSRYGEGAPRPAGSAMSATFELEGQSFIALNGGPHFSFTPAVSFFVTCQTQDEIDHFWDKLSAGGEVQRCGWLKDKYGLSWQIVPAVLGELLQHPDPATARRVMTAMLAMIKLDIAALQQAAAAPS
jgi:predicted 3-demethylubiquinone-9 3-methyltransferase (glyoxalase superfamily)